MNFIITFHLSPHLGLYDENCRRYKQFSSKRPRIRRIRPKITTTCGTPSRTKSTPHVQLLVHFRREQELVKILL